MVAQNDNENASDPLRLLREAAVSALKRTAADPQRQHAFILRHQCEYLEDMAGMKQRLSDLKCECISDAETAIRTGGVDPIGTRLTL